MCLKCHINMIPTLTQQPPLLRLILLKGGGHSQNGFFFFLSSPINFDVEFSASKELAIPRNKSPKKPKIRHRQLPF